MTAAPGSEQVSTPLVFLRRSFLNSRRHNLLHQLDAVVAITGQQRSKRKRHVECCILVKRGFKRREAPSHPQTATDRKQ